MLFSSTRCQNYTTRCRTILSVSYRIFAIYLVVCSTHFLQALPSSPLSTYVDTAYGILLTSVVTKAPSRAEVAQGIEVNVYFPLIPFTPTPHDATFRQFLTQQDIARGFMEIHLPAELRAVCDLSTLKLESGSFAKDDLR